MHIKSNQVQRFAYCDSDSFASFTRKLYPERVDPKNKRNEYRTRDYRNVTESSKRRLDGITQGDVSLVQVFIDR